MANSSRRNQPRPIPYIVNSQDSSAERDCSSLYVPQPHVTNLPRRTFLAHRRHLRTDSNLSTPDTSTNSDRHQERTLQMSETYFIKRGESINGPFTLKKLQKALSDKKLKANDELSTSNDGPWERLSAVHKDIKAGKHPHVVQEAPVNAEDIMDEWTTDDQPAPVKPPPEVEGSPPQADSYSLPSQSPEIVAEHDDDDGDEVDDPPLPTVKVSTTSTDVANEVQSESRQSRLKAINPIAAAAIAAAGIVVVGMVVILLARATGFQRGDAIKVEHSYLPAGLSKNEVAKAFAGIYQYHHVGDERPDGSVDEWMDTIYLIYAPTSDRQGVFYDIGIRDDRVSQHGHWDFYDCYQAPAGKEYYVQLSRCPTSTYKDAGAELFYQINKNRDVSILADRYIDIGNDRVYHKVGPITDDMLERVEIPDSGKVTYKLKKYPDHTAE